MEPRHQPGALLTPSRCGGGDAAREHIGRRVLRHREAGGELTEDPVWQWSSAPRPVLDTALRVGLAANAGVRLGDWRTPRRFGAVAAGVAPRAAGAGISSSVRSRCRDIADHLFARTSSRGEPVLGNTARRSRGGCRSGCCNASPAKRSLACRAVVDGRWWLTTERIIAPVQSWSGADGPEGVLRLAA